MSPVSADSHSMPPTAPTCDDRPIWDVWLSLMWLPAVTVADELEIFDSLAGAGFVDVEVVPTYSYYSIVRGTKR